MEEVELLAGLSDLLSEKKGVISFIFSQKIMRVLSNLSRPHTPWTIYCKVLLTKLVVAIEREGVEEEAERERMAR
jgi:hypothetical protein